MTFHLAAPEHAVRNRPGLSFILFLLAGLGAASASADEHSVEAGDASDTEVEAGAVEEQVTAVGEIVDAVADVSESADQIDVDSIVDPIMPGTNADEASNAPVVVSDIDGIEIDMSELEAEEVPDPVELTPHSAEYKVKISVLSGRLNTSLVRTEDGYEANHRIRPTGLARMVSGGTIEEFSSFQNTADGIVPVHYVSSDTLTRDKTQANVGFDWETNTITGTVNEQDVEVVLEEFAHDRVSTQYQLMSDLMNGGVAERYVLYDIDEIKILNVTVIGEREIRVPAGEFTAIGVQHQAEGSSRVTTLWCVEELDYLPVMIEQHRRDELRMRAQLRSYTPIEG